MARCVKTALAVFCFGVVPCILWYFYPHIISKYIALISEGLAGFKAWCTPPLLFLIMNGVVLALAFTSGFIKQWSFRSRDDEEREDLNKTRRRENAEDYAIEEGEVDQVVEEAEDSLCTEVLNSFFGEGGTVTRRKPLMKHAFSTERRGRSFYPSLSHKLNPGPSLVANASPRVLRHAHVAPKPVTFGFKRPVPISAAAQASNDDGRGGDVDERADAFIGDFYKKMKVRQMDPYIESLERRFGR